MYEMVKVNAQILIKRVQRAFIQLNLRDWTTKYSINVLNFKKFRPSMEFFIDSKNKFMRVESLTNIHPFFFFFLFTYLQGELRPQFLKFNFFYPYHSVLCKKKFFFVGLENFSRQAIASYQIFTHQPSISNL